MREGLAIGDASRAGYVLIEVAAALAVFGLLVAFGFPLVSGATTGPRFSGLLTSTVALLRDTRSAALSGGKPVAARFDPQGRRLTAGALAVAVPGDVAVHLTAGGACPADRRETGIVFRPDGTNCGGILRFTEGRRTATVRIDWATGRIDVRPDG